LLKYYIYLVWALITIAFAIICLLIPLWILISPILLLVGLLIYLLTQTPYIGDAINKFYLGAYDWVFYRSNYPRKILWRFIYDSMCLFYP